MFPRNEGVNIYQVIRRHILEDSNFHTHHYESNKFRPNVEIGFGPTQPRIQIYKWKFNCSVKAVPQVHLIQRLRIRKALI
jgi:hypothetical protein